MESFEIGEVAIYCNPKSPYFGREVTVLSDLQYKENIKNLRTGERASGMRYQITNLYPERVIMCFARPEHLRKKKPPRESVDIQRTRRDGAPSWEQVKKNLNKETV